ncbi:microtubule-actin cross-linking factor 1, isoforms 1/2/3/5 [Planoprotostelium fungivorum]|uniref:Microtubule-actin cross-linking factor 1, isoforms 1/2/3/5 n=1 Tax=Planoprotostelium fungivorum TaxID=1890364 RepID=A0A2P6NN96_9EUKA|nr:microtubule-actin cross-linking factor 1, isoforms 1/2/3/5 [Planoprotostelium fungivorum]
MELQKKGSRNSLVIRSRQNSFTNLKDKAAERGPPISIFCGRAWQVTMWLEDLFEIKLIEEEFQPMQLAQFLYNGEKLCALINMIIPDIIPVYDIGKNKTKNIINNINLFLKACSQHLELTEEDLFTLPDLYELLDFKSVVDCLFHIDRVAAEKFDFDKRIPPLKSQIEQPKEVKVHKISVGNYMFGEMKVHIKAINGKLSVRVGGGWMYLEDFLLKHNSKIDIEMIKKDVLGPQYVSPCVPPRGKVNIPTTNGKAVAGKQLLVTAPNQSNQQSSPRSRIPSFSKVPSSGYGSPSPLALNRSEFSPTFICLTLSAVSEPVISSKNKTNGGRTTPTPRTSTPTVKTTATPAVKTTTPASKTTTTPKTLSRVASLKTHTPSSSNILSPVKSQLSPNKSPLRNVSPRVDTRRTPNNNSTTKTTPLASSKGIK